jgi:hypothetical protein
MPTCLQAHWVGNNRMMLQLLPRPAVLRLRVVNIGLRVEPTMVFTTKRPLDRR